MSDKVFIEENGIYRIDCSQSLWAINELNRIYHDAKIDLSDVDFIIETKKNILLVEYKNANIPSATNPEAFMEKIDPENPKNNDLIRNIARKYYDTLHYLKRLKKEKPVRFVCIIEALTSGLTDRLLFRNKIQKKLPFLLQENVKGKGQLIENFELLSIAEWNEHEEYSAFPLSKVEGK